MPLDYRNTNTLWCSLLAETLARCGVRHAIISPGSRSTPLTNALARQAAVETIPVLDERTAAFFALGLAKQHRRPVLLVCTSGTAGANYLPALVEARESATPLLVLTADRPPEMRECHSGQTIDQQNLYGKYAAWFHELPVPEPDLALLRYLRQTAAHAYQRALHHSAPVHLNLPFRDPLAPIENDTAKHLENNPELNNDQFFAHLNNNTDDKPPPRKIPLEIPSGKVLVIAGPDAPETTHQLAAHLNAPLLTDALASTRYSLPATRYPSAIAAYDTILRNEQIAAELAPDHVIAIGAYPTSKTLRAWLEKTNPRILQLTKTIANKDPLHGRTRQLVADPDELEITSENPSPDYLQRWQQLEQSAQTHLAAALEKHPESEPAHARSIIDKLPPETPLFIANSMPVRDAETYCPATNCRHQIHTNRGANGIDGTLSTALGIAHRNRPTVLITGDLAFLHDNSALLLKTEFHGSLTIILINNNGGGIFNHLPIADTADNFERFWATPQTVDIPKLCAAHAIEHISINNPARLAAALDKLPPSGIRVLEIKTNRANDTATRRQIQQQVAATLQ